MTDIIGSEKSNIFCNNHTLSVEYMKTQISYKKYFLIFVGVYAFFKLVPYVIEFAMQKTKTAPYVLIFGFLAIVGLSFVIIGIQGFITGKHSSLDPTFANKYKVEHGQIQIEEIKHYGVLGITRSIISIIIGVAILAVEGLVLYSVVLQR